MQKKKAAKKSVKSSKKTVKRGRGRPPVEFRKKSFHLLLDPRYIEHFREKALEMNVPPQDLGRMALNALVPDPFNPATVPEITQLLARLSSK